MDKPPASPELTSVRPKPFRRAVLRGLAVVLPPLLTIVIFVWVGNTVADYLLEPLETAARRIIVHNIADIKDPAKLEGLRRAESARGEGQDSGNGESLSPLPNAEREVRYIYKNQLLIQTSDGKLIPAVYYEYVRDRIGNEPMPRTAIGIYEKYVDFAYLRRFIVIPVFLLLFILVLYLLGKFLAAGVGKFFWHRFEQVIHQLPLIRNVYSSVKQVTDFVFSDSEIEYTRVVAVEYPRKGIWTLALVTGDSMLDIRSAANEPVMSVLVPTSPMPFTGFTVTVRKSETVDLNITIDQAFQFIVSCGVVVPPQQIAEALQERDGKAATLSQEAPALAAPGAGKVTS